MDTQKEVRKIKKRNKRVEGDKAWEISAFRTVVLSFFTFIVAYLIFWVSGADEPFLGAVVAAIAFFLSTLTIPPLKKWWIKKYFK
jgi:hypothetical protein